MIQVVQDPDFLPIPDPGSWIMGSKRHQIPNPDPQHCIYVNSLCSIGAEEDFQHQSDASAPENPPYNPQFELSHHR
jgi:hypothetical protein